MWQWYAIEHYQTIKVVLKSRCGEIYYKLYFEQLTKRVYFTIPIKKYYYILLPI